MQILLAVGVACFLAGCSTPADDDGPTGPEPTIALSVEAQPQAIPANGNSRLVVFTEVRRGDQAVADSTEVVLLNSMGTLQHGIVYTHGGVALDTLTSDTSAGTGWVIAYTQGVRDSVEIMFTEVP